MPKLLQNTISLLLLLSTNSQTVQAKEDAIVRLYDTHMATHYKGAKETWAAEHEKEVAGEPIRRFFEDLDETFDFIVVGAGSGGCALASRLSEAGKWHVLLLEAGEQAGWFPKVPLFAPGVYHTDYAHKYFIERQENFGKGLEDRIMAWPRGRGVGGSSLMNYMIYTRGHPLDFDRWAEAGNYGWSYKEILPYFLRSEGASHITGLDPLYHNTNGPLKVSDSFQGDLAHAFVEAGKQMGFEEVDYTSPKVFGFSTVKSTTYQGRRCDAGTAYIDPNLSRKNLHLRTHSHATKVLIDPDNNAYGVRYYRHGKMRTALARKEVILSGGVLGSPHLLLLSGIGPTKQLEQFDIPVIQDLPVGRNLEDHLCYLGLPILVNDTSALSTTDLLNPINFFNYIVSGKGPLASIGGIEAIAFFKTTESDETSDYPDMELLLAGSYITVDAGTLTRRAWRIETDTYFSFMGQLHWQRVFTIIPVLMHPKSIGWLELRSRNPFMPPKLFGNYLSDPENKDMKTMIATMKFITKLLKTPAFQKHGARIFDVPVPGCGQTTDEDEYWECAMRSFAVTLHHQIGTCRMGPNRTNAVVDPELRVFGVKNLRVADSSVIPASITGHTNALSMAIGEKAAEMLKKDWDELSPM